MSAYYNERDDYAAAWLRNLIAAGHIAPGVVDTRSITEVSADDLRGFTQCHFFAGIGVWSHALRRAGWPDDARHLWPVWFRLIDQCRPAAVLGEQVASALQWLDLVSADMEGTGYAFGASDLCAAGFDGAHIRQRLYFAGLAHTVGAGWRQAGRNIAGDISPHGAEARNWFGDASQNDGLADADSQDRSRGRIFGPGEGAGAGAGAAFERSAGLCATGGLADTDADRQQAGGLPVRSGQPGEAALVECGGGQSRSIPAPMLGRHAADWLWCRDGKWRPVEPGTFPLVDAAPARVGRLRAFGNALDAETAAGFCGAVIDTLADLELAA